MYYHQHHRCHHNFHYDHDYIILVIRHFNHNHLVYGSITFTFCSTAKGKGGQLYNPHNLCHHHLFQENELTSITGGGSLSDLQDLHVSVFRPIFIYGTTDTVQRNCAFDSRTEICSFTHPIPILFTLANIQSRLTNQPTQMQWINLQYFHINTYAIKT